MSLISKECLAVANKIIEETNLRVKSGINIVMTCSRLQKILYLCYVEYFKKYNKFLFNDDFEAWSRGPAIPAIYDRFLMYQNGIMYPTGDKYELDEDIYSIISSVVELTKCMDTYDIELFIKGMDDLYIRWYDDREGTDFCIIPKYMISKYYRNSDESILSLIKKY